MITVEPGGPHLIYTINTDVISYCQSVATILFLAVSASYEKNYKRHSIIDNTVIQTNLSGSLEKSLDKGVGVPLY